jgi:hypothetical protein
MKAEIELLMLKLADGARVLRFSEPISGLCLEKRLDPNKPVAKKLNVGNLLFALCSNAKLALRVKRRLPSHPFS